MGVTNHLLTGMILQIISNYGIDWCLSVHLKLSRQETGASLRSPSEKKPLEQTDWQFGDTPMDTLPKT